jgi:uncharacterized membrane protein HdeD (DUF308 family)
MLEGRGVLAILLGILALTLPGHAFLAMLLIFGAYLFLDGLMAFVMGVKSYGEDGRWWVLACEGLLGVAMGVAIWFWPVSAGVALLFWIAAWAIVTGVMELVEAVRLRKVISHEWLLGLAGIASVLFGILVIRNPVPGAIALIWLVGAYMLAFGVLFVSLGFRVRHLGYAR